MITAVSNSRIGHNSQWSTFILCSVQTGNMCNKAISLIIIGHGWPLNYYFIYEVITMMVIAVILVSFALPKSSEKKRLPADSEHPKTHATDSVSSEKQLPVT